ncbi:uncharacterized protein HaLaN_13253 [Haematococcus lacustris]|uniref:Uncharacterized protein n=1 Tax=Haematococcus lacustris TaxID=44745 RepID=A0A699ZD12_HAELA|nr:uncharacterized protein HaLaN_13253 [Haematococcus lacustris]
MVPFDCSQVKELLPCNEATEVLAQSNRPFYMICKHTSRSLVLWLSTLPLALWPVTEWLSVPAMFIIAFVFIGIDEIGVEIEEPFCLLPLLPMCRTIVNDTKIAMGLANAA